MANRYHLSPRFTVELTDLGVVVCKGAVMKRVHSAEGFAELCVQEAGGRVAHRQILIVAALVAEADDRGLSHHMDPLAYVALEAMGARRDYQHTAFGNLCAIVDGDAKYINAAVKTLSDERACKSEEAWQTLHEPARNRQDAKI